jgi:hypothetical protein
MNSQVASPAKIKLPFGKPPSYAGTAESVK